MMFKNILPEQAVALILEQPVLCSKEELPLSEALDRVIAETISARRDLPPFDKSPFDGYAFRSEDVPGILKLIGTQKAGAKELLEIKQGEAIQIFTGAPVPKTADAVLKLEDVTRQGDTIAVCGPVLPGTNVIRQGEDLRQGDLLLSEGTRIQPAHLGVLAGQGIANVVVYRKPKAAICPTGTELSEPGDVCPPYGIYNSSSDVLSAYLRRLGFEVSRCPVIPDEPTAIQTAVEKALVSDADVVFTTGGASVGDYDFAMQTAKSIGADILFWKVQVKPGGALLVSRFGSKLLISLSGNPAAALMSLLVVLRPWLITMTGGKDRAELIHLPLKEDLPKSSSVLRLLRGHLDLSGDTVCFAEHKGRGNGNIASFINCNLIGLVPAGSGPLKKGERIQVLRFPPELC